MARGNTIPKDPSKRQRRNAETTETVELEDQVEADVVIYEMPPGDWAAETVHWWETWCRSQQAAQFIDTDWLLLRLMVPLVDQYVRTPTKDLLGELRLQHAKFGATPEDRLRLRWSMRKSDQAAEREEKVAAAGGGGSATSSRAKPDPRMTVIQGGKAS